MTFDFCNAQKSESVFEAEMDRYRIELKIANLENRIKDAGTDEEFEELFNQLEQAQKDFQVAVWRKFNAFWTAAQK